MKMVATAGVVFLGLIGGCAGGGAKHAEIRSVAQSVIDAANAGDEARASSWVITGSSFVSVHEGQRRHVDVRSASEWIVMLGARGDEQDIGSSFMMIEDGVAMLFRERESGREGVDIFTFVRTDDGWKLAGGVSSFESGS